jgi:hypothetical protein
VLALAAGGAAEVRAEGDRLQPLGGELGDRLELGDLLGDRGGELVDDLATLVEGAVQVVPAAPPEFIAIVEEMETRRRPRSRPPP